MFKTLKSKIRLFGRKPVGRLGKLVSYKTNEQGIAAIEFAMIAPLMIALYFGVSEISMAVGADRKVSHSTSVAADLITQEEEMNEDDLQNVLTATLMIMGISNDDITSNKFGIEILSYGPLDADDNLGPLIGKSTLGKTISPPFSTSELTPMVNQASGAVIVRIIRDYEPVTYKFMSDITLKEKFIMKPRKSTSIPFKNGSGNSFSCTATVNLEVTCS